MAKGTDALVGRVAGTLGTTRKAARRTLLKVFECVEGTLAESIDEDGFYVKLGGLGKLVVRHRPPSVRRLNFSGQALLVGARRKVRFVALGRLRGLERVPPPAQAPTHQEETAT
jgi:nucleoid DNA-binding protein